MCVPGGESAHTDGSACVCARACVCVRVRVRARALGLCGVGGRGDSPRCSKQDTATSPHAFRLQGQAPLHGNRKGT